MLKTLQIRNFALAEKLQIEFRPGLNIITGETGAGKSILVGAISAVLGARVFTEVVRTGAEKAFVEAVFDISNQPSIRQKLEEKGLEAGDELLLKREISSKGSTRAFVNDFAVTISTLAEIGDLLVDIHSQNEHQSLLRREIHGYFLDQFGRLNPLLQEVTQTFRRLEKTASELNRLQQKQQELNEKYELYQFQLDEINQANPLPGEDEELERERKILVNLEKISALANQFQQIMNGSEAANLLELMGQASHLLGELAEFSPDLKSIYQEFSSARIIADEAARTVEEFQNRQEFDPERLEEIENRLATLNHLKKKYGGSIEHILAHRDRVQEELQLKENFEFEVAKLQKSLEEARLHYQAGALKLSAARKKVARQLEKVVEQELKKLGMGKTRFQVQFSWQEDLNGWVEYQGKRYYGDANGLDQMEFYISPNPGEDFKPLAKIASGGEISRIMLALKNILAEIDHIPLLIFDEIDVGVSGKIAMAVGKSIRQLAASHQIICITHLPQIAAFGDHHFRVEKFVSDGRTYTRVRELTPQQRVEEIAYLMGGQTISDAILKSARELLEESRQTVHKEKNISP